MKIPGGWKDFFKNVFIATCVFYILNYLIAKDANILKSVIFAISMCSVIAFLESRFRGSKGQSIEEQKSEVLHENETHTNT